jgi:plastocyanin
VRRPTLIALSSVAVLVAATLGGFAVAGASTPKPRTVTISASKCPGGKQFCFKGGTVTVARATKVIWKNNTIAPHTVTRCTMSACHVSGGTGKQAGLNSPTINPGKTYAFTFRKPGTYRFYCAVHGYPVMHGTITVR